MGVTDDMTGPDSLPDDNGGMLEPEHSHRDHNANEETPLIRGDRRESWTPPRGFYWIEIGEH